MSTPKEDTVETYLNLKVQLAGGFTVKLNPRGYKGIQDRLVVLPGRVIFVELKRPRGGRVAELQRWWKSRFANLGHEAAICNTAEEVDRLLDEPPRRV